MFAWEMWSIPLLSVGLAALVVVPCALARPLWENYRYRCLRHDWERQVDPLEQALAQLSAWDGYLPAWVVARSDAH